MNQRSILLGLLLVGATAACRTGGEKPDKPRETKLRPERFAYPPAPRSEVFDDYHGTRVTDEFRILEELDAPQTTGWVTLQNELSGSFLGSLPSRETFAWRLHDLLAAEATPRVRRGLGGWLIQRPTSDGRNRFSFQDELGGRRRVLLEPTDIPDLTDPIRTVALSPNKRLLAYVVDRHGSAALELRIRDLERGVDLPERIPGVRWGHPHWTADGRAVIYSRLLRPGIDEPDGVDRESIIGYHSVGSSVEDDVILYRVNPTDVGAGAGATLSSDGRLIVIEDLYANAESISVIDLNDPLNPKPTSEFIALTAGRTGKSQFLGSLGRTVYLRTTLEAPRGRIVAVHLDHPREWQTVVPESEHLLERALLAGGRLLVGYMRHACSDMHVFDLDGQELFSVELPALGSAYYFSGDERTPTATFAFDSFTHPEVVLSCDLQTGKTTLFQPSALALDPYRYVTEQLFCNSPDGTQIPMFVARRRDTDTPAPVLLYGYGAVGDVLGPIFSPDLFAWVDAGGVLAVANVRGGGEYGEAWHRAGMLDQKQNTFDDFIAVAEHLIDSGVTTSDQLAMHGLSNGGLLVGAVLTQRPDLFAAALPAVGVLDCLRFPSLTAGPRWAKEMGDPAVPEQFAWLLSWSPLHRIEDGQQYPATLITTARDDDVVHPSQSYKFAARLQEAQGSESPVLLRVYESGGHAGRMDLAGRVEELADRLGFAAHFTHLEPRSD